MLQPRIYLSSADHDFSEDDYRTVEGFSARSHMKSNHSLESLRPRSDEGQPITLRIPQACQATGISRTKLYQLLKSGKITSMSLREPGQKKATRLILYSSLLEYLHSQIDNQQK